MQKVAVIVTNYKPDLPVIEWEEQAGPADTVIYRVVNPKDPVIEGSLNFDSEGVVFSTRNLVISKDYIIDFRREIILSWGFTAEIPKDVCREKFNADFGIYFSS